MFNQILVPLDRSLLAENILPHAIAMAQAYKSRITLVSVMDPGIGDISQNVIDPFDWQLQQAEAEAYLKDLSSSLLASGLEVDTILLDGKAPDHVIQQSNRMDTKLIMMSSHGQGGISGWNSSSVVTKIIQQARTSVMVIRSYPSFGNSITDIRYQRILVPVDGSQRAEYVLSTATHLARSYEAELLIAHVIKPPELPRRTPLSKRDRSLVQQIVDSNHAEADHYLTELKKSLNYTADTRVLISHSVTDTLHKLIEQERIDLMILNAHGIGGNPRWPYGNVTLNFLTYSAIPLLVIQDFDRDLLIETQSELFAKDFLGQPQQLLDEFKQKFREVNE